MRADENLYLAGDKTFEHLATLLSFHDAREKFHPDAETTKKLRYGGEVLLGEDFGGSHDARLITIVEGDEHCHQRHKGLAGAYVALEETIHLSSGTHVVTYLVHHSLLRTGKTEGEVLRIEVVEQLAYMLENIAAILATMV